VFILLVIWTPKNNKQETTFENFWNCKFYRLVTICVEILDARLNDQSRQWAFAFYPLINISYIDQTNSIGSSFTDFADDETVA